MARRKETRRREEPLWEGPRESRGHGDQREKRNDVLLKGRNRNALSRGRHEGQDGPSGQGPR